MRPSGLTSIAPNLLKSTSGTFGSAPPDEGMPPLMICLTKALTSSGVMRPLMPLPLRATDPRRVRVQSDVPINPHTLWQSRLH